MNIKYQGCNIVQEDENRYSIWYNGKKIKPNYALSESDAKKYINKALEEGIPFETRNIDKTYNGWKNRETWNVALWINNDEDLYQSAVEFMESYDTLNPYKDFINYYGIGKEKTPDGIQWLSRVLDYKELNDMMFDLID